MHFIITAIATIIIQLHVQVSALLKCRIITFNIMQTVTLNYTPNVRVLTFNVKVQAICYINLFCTTIAK